uniref:Uncharacterized protein n=1 Tax=Opuntia streptacantha TaxID=393608 RepID=A0A7C9DDJ3_OPUST
MASCRTFSSIPLIRCSSTVFSLIHFSTFPSSRRPVSRALCVISSASRSIQYSSNTDPASDILTMRRTWKPMCLYYTQGKCTLEFGLKESMKLCFGIQETIIPEIRS